MPLPAALGPAVALAADDISIATASRYTVVPKAGRVRVVVDITAANEKPNKVTGGTITRYFYDGVNLAIQPEARTVRATQDGRPIKVDLAKRKGYRLATILFRENLYYGETARIRLTFDLPGGEPRSESDIRVGSAFATFTAWAFGDRGSVRVEVPKGFRVEIVGADMEQEPDAKGLQVWSATTTRPLDWYAWVTATNDEALTRDRLTLDGGDEVVIRGWPEDKRWRSRVRDLLRDGVPGARGPDRARLAGGRVARHLRGAHAAARGLRRLLRSRDGRDHDQRGPRRPHDHPRGVARLVQQVAVHRALDHRGTRRRVRGARPARPGPRLPGAAGVKPRGGGRVPALGLAAARRDPRRGEPGPRVLRVCGELVPHAQDREARGRGWHASRIRRRCRGHHGLSGRGATRAESPAQRLAAVPGSRRRARARSRTRPRSPTWWRRSRSTRPTASSCRRVPPRGVRSPDLVEAGGEWAAPVVVRMAMDRWDFDDATEAMDRAADVLAVRDEIAQAAAVEGLEPAEGPEADYQDAGSIAELAVAKEDGGPQPRGAAAGRRGVRCRRGAEGLVHRGGSRRGRSCVRGGRGAGCLGARGPRGRRDRRGRCRRAAPGGSGGGPDEGPDDRRRGGAGPRDPASPWPWSWCAAGAARRRRSRAAATAAAGAGTPPDLSGSYATLPPEGPPAEPPGRPPSGDEGADPS